MSSLIFRYLRSKIYWIMFDCEFTRCIISKINENDIYILPVTNKGSGIRLLLSPEQNYLIEYAWEGATLNLIDCRTCNDGILAKRIILHPDYLIDISALAACFKEYGPHALHYIYHLIEPSDPSAYTLLGNTVNLFFDNNVRENSVTYRDCLMKTFHDEALAYLSVPECDLRKIYFQRIESQYHNTETSVNDLFQLQHPPLNKKNGWLEPSFVCPQLGLSGRLDYLELYPDHHASVVELKSGKWNDYAHQAKQSHYIQTMLYAEVIHFNQGIDYSNINCYLLYNTYPLLNKEIYISHQVEEAFHIRNRIIGYLHQIIEGHADALFSSDKVNEISLSSSPLWIKYERPQLLTLIQVIECATESVRQWFFSQIQYIVKEEELNRIGGTQSYNNDRAACNMWLQSTTEKLQSGKVIYPLTIATLDTQGEEVFGITLKLSEPLCHDFRLGDSIVIYPATQEKESIVSKQIVLRGNIVNYDDKTVSVALRQSVRTIHLNTSESVTYICEHDIINSSLGLACRAIYRMLLAPIRWQDLLINGALPELPVIPSDISVKTQETNNVENLVEQMFHTPEYFLLVGPPGTGKTSVLLKSLISRLYQDTQESVLILSYTHRAVDEISQTLEQLIAEGIPALDYIRLGTNFDCHPDYHHRLLCKKVEESDRRSTLQKIIDEQRIFLSTTSRMNAQHHLFNVKQFDTIIVDEASQLLDYHCIELLTHAKRFILIGDPKQLPAVSLQTEGVSLFERLYRMTMQKASSVIGELHTQGRMHPEVAKFANRMFYNNQLQMVPLSHQLEKDGRLPRYGFIHVDAPILKGRKFNENEAIETARLIAKIYNAYQSDKIPFRSNTIGVIVPYRNQIATIRNAMSELQIDVIDKINIDTVERYQGSQRDIIIFCTTVSTKQQMEQLCVPIEINQTIVDRKLNVAITRARKHLYIIGNKEILSHSSIYAGMIDAMEQGV